MKQSKSTRTSGRTPRKPKPAAGRKAAPNARTPAPRKAASGRTSTSRAKARAGEAAAGASARSSTAVPGLLALPAECLIAGVDELRSDLLKHLDSTTAVTFDASAVQRIDTASLQVIAAFARDRRAAGLAFAWSGVPAAVTDAAALLNLTETLGLDAAAAADADTVLA